MSYDTAPAEKYEIPSVAFGNAASQRMYIGPPGKTGTVVDIEAHTLSADMVGTTSVPEIAVGLTAGSAEYARFRLGTTAILGYTTASAKSRRASQIASSASGRRTQTDFTEHVALQKAVIPADTVFMISLVAGVGGSPAGTSGATVWIRWD